jgi:hypothetical protein
VSFDLGGPASLQPDALVRVLDVRGRIVRTLRIIDAVRGAGFVRWDALDATGVPAATGLYIAEFQNGVQRVRRKFVLLR